MNRVERLTAPGTSALACVRLSGAGARAWTEQRFSKPPVVGRATHGELRDEQGVLDDPVCVANADGSTDLTLHGNPLIVQTLMQLAIADGFVNAQAIAATIDDEVRDAWPRVRTELGARLLAAQPEAWARIEADDRDEMLADRSLEHLLTPPCVAIVGVPNAGKSTLANQLFGQRRSIVSDTPGTTRDWVGELADLDGLVVELIDTPGRRETGDAIERAAIALSDAPIAAAELVVVLLDPTQPAGPQRAIAASLDRSLLVSNKLDLSAPIDGAIGVCAKSGDGIDALIAAIHARFDVGRRPESAARVWTPRQRALLKS